MTLDEKAMRARLELLHARLAHHCATNSVEAARDIAATLLGQRDERGWIAHLAIVLLSTPMSQAIPAWRALRSRLIPHWGASLDFVGRPGRRTHLTRAVQHPCMARVAKALIELGADPERRGLDGLSCVERMRLNHQERPDAGWDEILDMLGSKGSFAERAILDQAIGGPLEQSAAPPRRARARL